MIRVCVYLALCFGAFLGIVWIGCRAIEATSMSPRDVLLVFVLIVICSFRGR